MPSYHGFTEDLKSCSSYDEKGRLLEAALNSFRNNSVSQTDLKEMKSFIFEEISILMKVIPAAPDYKAKDEMFFYEDKLMGLFRFLYSKKIAFTGDEIAQIKDLAELVAKYQVLETSISKMLGLDKISIWDIKKVIETAMSTTDEYQKGFLFHGLLNCEKDIHKFSSEAKEEISNYIASELERYLNHKDQLTEDEINNLEIASDACKNFLNDKMIQLLKQISNFPHNNIRYYAISTLLSCNQEVSTDVIAALAKDLEYAELTHNLLMTHNLTERFPNELNNPEYLAKSDLVRWLTYPTELGTIPDQIVFLGEVKVKRQQFYIFKYMSDSDNLSDDLRNNWLIGWSSNGGDTFSDFDRLCDYEQKTPEKTLKVIKKKLIK